MLSALKPGTPCLIKTPAPFARQHNGKVVVVVRSKSKGRLYECSPSLSDAQGRGLVWRRSSLRPLDGGDGEDEMLTITGKPLPLHDTEMA